MSQTAQAIEKLPFLSEADCSSVELRKTRAVDWFKQLRNDICQRFESLEKQAVNLYPELYGEKAGSFTYTPWMRGQNVGGGEMGVMHGALFEKVGVNISTVWGTFSEPFQKQIPGAEEDPRFWASGISLVAHMRNPHVPAVHMNTRHIVTTKQWFGGGMDLTPCFPHDEDTHHFHQTLQQMADQHDSTFYEAQKKWCDRYFYLPHREEPRGIGGIFYDYLNRGNWETDFAYNQDVGRAFCDAYAPIVEKRMGTPWTPEDDAKLLKKRGRYAEFNLIYDRGTAFGLKTGGNTEAILMSLPPRVTWP